MAYMITVDHQYFECNKLVLPCLIAGANKSGASYFSICLVVKIIQSGFKVIFFTAFPMAKEELLNQISEDCIYEITSSLDLDGIPLNKSLVIKSGDIALREETIDRLGDKDQYIVFVKNIEEYDSQIISKLHNNPNILLSGSLDECDHKSELWKRVRKSKIIFTVPEFDSDLQIPNLQKYESYLISNESKGIVRIENN